MQGKFISKAALAALSLLTYAQSAFAATQAEYYVSPNGNDSSSGSLEQPFKSLAKAQQQVRAINSNMTGDIVVNLMAGDYYLEQAFSLNASDSGSNGHQVIYKNHDEPGSARIIGGQTITGWQLHSGNIYRAQVADMSFETLFVNGSRATLARHPNNDYLRIESADEAEPRKAFYHFAGDIPAISDLTNLQIFVWPGAHDWANEILPIVSIDANRKITLSEQQRFKYLGDLKANSRYFIQGALELLDQPGEFYLDKAQGYLYYYPITDDITTEQIIAPSDTKTLVIRGNSDDLAENIKISGLTVMVSDYSYLSLNGANMGNIIVSNAKNIEISDNQIRNAALNGVAISAFGENQVHDITVTGNDIFDVGGSGVVARGNNYTKHYVNTGHLISNNRIRNVAKISTNGAGIQIANVGYTTISHNDISDAQHYGIEVKGSKWMLMPDMLDGEAVTEQNKYDFNPGRYNTVEFNKVYNVNLDAQDTGIYKSGGTYQTTVNNNLFYNSGADFGIQKGIYLDDVSDYTFVTNNIVYGLSASNIKNPAMNVKGTGSVIRNNVFHFDSTGMRLLEFNNQQSKDNRVEQNIFYSTTSNLIYDFATPFASKLVEAADNNLFYTPGEGIFRPLPDTEDTLLGWQSLDDNKYDQNSLVADPLFANAASHDYHLQASSPALTQLGFEQIDTTEIGLKDSFIYQQQSAAPSSMFSAHESFEHNFNNWTTANLGTPSTTDVQAHLGSQSYMLDEDQDQIGYQLPQATNALISVWFYDDADDNSMKVKAQVSGEQSHLQIGVVTYNATDYYSYQIDGSTFLTSTVARTTGWHQFSFDLTSGKDAKLYIDDVLIATTSNVTVANKVVLGDNAKDGKQGQVLFDNLTIVTDLFDSFEQGVGQWTIAAKGEATLTTDKASSGAFSYYLDEDVDQIGYQLPQAVNGIISVKFYDDISNDNMKVKAQVGDNADNNVQIGVVTYKSADKYSFLLDGSFVTSAVARTTGWHEFKFDFSSGIDVKLYIDNSLVGITSKVTEVQKVILGDNANDGKIGRVWFDDLLLMVHKK